MIFYDTIKEYVETWAWWSLHSRIEAIPRSSVGNTQLMVNSPDYSKGAISNRSVRLIVDRMCSGRLCGMVRLLLSVEKLLRGAGLLVVADWTVRRALHQRHWHPGVSARADHSHNSTSVTVSPRIPAHDWFRSHLRCEIIDDDDDDDQRAR